MIQYIFCTKVRNWRTTAVDVQLKKVYLLSITGQQDLITTSYYLIIIITGVSGGSLKNTRFCDWEEKANQNGTFHPPLIFRSTILHSRTYYMFLERGAAQKHIVCSSYSCISVQGQNLNCRTDTLISDLPVFQPRSRFTKYVTSLIII